MSSERLTIFKKKYKKTAAPSGGPLYKRGVFYYNIQNRFSRRMLQ